MSGVRPLHIQFRSQLMGLGYPQLARPFLNSDSLDGRGGISNMIWVLHTLIAKNRAFEGRLRDMSSEIIEKGNGSDNTQKLIKILELLKEIGEHRHVRAKMFSTSEKTTGDFRRILQSSTDLALKDIEGYDEQFKGADSAQKERLSLMIAKHLESKNPKIQMYALEVIAKRPYVSIVALDKVVKLLGDNDKAVSDRARVVAETIFKRL